MKKIKITFTVTVEYEPNPEFYPAGSTIEEMLDIDIKNAEDDPFMVLPDCPEWKIKGEIVK